MDCLATSGVRDHIALWPNRWIFLGVHAVTNSNEAGTSMIGVAVFGAIVGAVLARRFDRGQAVSRECDPPRTTRRRAVLPPSPKLLTFMLDGKGTLPVGGQ